MWPWWLLAWVMLSALTIGVHAALWHAPPPPPVFEPVLKYASNVLAMAAVPGRLAWRLLILPESAPPLWMASLWHGTGWAMMLGGAALVDWARRRWRGGYAAPPLGSASLARRRFLADGVSAAGFVAVGGVGLKGVVLDPAALRIERTKVPIRDLCPAPGRDSVRLVLLADTHLGPRVTVGLIERAVDMALALKPDLFVLAGDYVYSQPKWVVPGAELLRPLVERGGAPVVGVLGNHDQWADGPGMRRALTRVGVRLIDNTRVFFDPLRRTLSDHEQPGDAHALCIAGLGDLMTDVIDVESALAGVGHRTPRIVVAHHPDTAEWPSVAGSAHRIDLMLSGHTHGGQVKLPLLGTPIVASRYGSRYAGGLVPAISTERGAPGAPGSGPRFPVLVSRGVGTSLLPVRWGVPPEVVEVTLVPG